MKYKSTPGFNENEISSIIYSEKYGCYHFRSYGEKIGKVVFDNLNEFVEHYNPTDLDNLLKTNDTNFQPASYEEMEFSSLHPDSMVMIDVFSIKSQNDLPYGVFDVRVSDRLGVILVPFKTALNDKNIVKNKNLKELVLDFFNNPNYNRKNKKGILLYGPPGNGKTTEVMSLFQIAQEQKIRVFIVDSDINLKGLRNYKKLLEQDRSIFVLEEVTERLGARGSVEDILTFTDGENSWNNSITIATTNYPEELPANLVDRPGRFDTFIEYGNPTKEDIINLGKNFDLTEDQVSPLFNQKLSFDYISFILSQSTKLNKSIKETREFEEDKRKRLSATFKGKIGI